MLQVGQGGAAAEAGAEGEVGVEIAGEIFLKSAGGVEAGEVFLKSAIKLPIQTAIKLPVEGRASSKSIELPVESGTGPKSSPQEACLGGARLSQRVK